MSENFKFGLISNASLISTPQDSLKNSEGDFTSVFGNYTNDYLKEIHAIYCDENFKTPFSYEHVMQNVFVEDYNNQAKLDIDEGNNFPSLEFEC